MNYKRWYVPNSLIFITIVTHDRKPILVDSIKLLIKSYINISKFYKFELIAYTIMNDHIHCIINPQNINEYPKIVKSFKYSFTKNIQMLIQTNNKIWQNRYWGHVILNENDLYKHLDYIHYNSVKHYNIMPKNWQYSSFNSFVLNKLYDIDWCNFEDKYSIINLNLE